MKKRLTNRLVYRKKIVIIAILILGFCYGSKVDAIESSQSSNEIETKSVDINYQEWEQPEGFTKVKDDIMPAVKIDVNPKKGYEQFLVFGNFDQSNTTLKQIRNNQSTSRSTVGKNIKESSIPMTLPRIVTYKANDLEGYGVSYTAPHDKEGNSPTNGGSGISLIAYDQRTNKVKYQAVAGGTGRSLSTNIINSSVITEFYLSQDKRTAIIYGNYKLGTNPSITNTINVPMRLIFEPINKNGKSQVIVSFKNNQAQLNNLNFKMGFSVNMDIMGQGTASRIYSLGSQEGVYFKESMKPLFGVDKPIYLGFHTSPHSIEAGVNSAEGIRTFITYPMRNYDRELEGYLGEKMMPNSWYKGGDYKVGRTDLGKHDDLSKETGDGKFSDPGKDNEVVYRDYSKRNYPPFLWEGVSKVNKPSWHFYYPGVPVPKNGSDQMVSYGFGMTASDTAFTTYDSISVKVEKKPANNFKDSKFSADYNQALGKPDIVPGRYYPRNFNIDIKLDELLSFNGSEFYLTKKDKSHPNGTAMVSKRQNPSNYDYEMTAVPNKGTVNIRLSDDFLKKQTEKSLIKINQSPTWINFDMSQKQAKDHFNKEENTFDFKATASNSWEIFNEGSIEKYRYEDDDTLAVPYTPKIDSGKVKELIINPGDKKSPKEFFTVHPKHKDFINWTDDFDFSYEVEPDAYKGGIGVVKVTSKVFGTSEFVQVRTRLNPIKKPVLEIIPYPQTEQAKPIEEIKLNTIYRAKINNAGLANDTYMDTLSLTFEVSPTNVTPVEKDYDIYFEERDSLSNSYNDLFEGDVDTKRFTKLSKSQYDWEELENNQYGNKRRKIVLKQDFLKNKKGNIVVVQHSPLMTFDNKNNLFTPLSDGLTKEMTQKDSINYDWNTQQFKFDTLFYGLTTSVVEGENFRDSIATKVLEQKSQKYDIAYNVRPKVEKIKLNPKQTFTANLIGGTGQIGPGNLLDAISYQNAQEVRQSVKGPQDIKNNAFPWDSGKTSRGEFIPVRFKDGKIPDMKTLPKEGTLELEVKSRNFNVPKLIKIPYIIQEEQVDMAISHRQKVDEKWVLIKNINKKNVAVKEEEIEDVPITTKKVIPGKLIRDQLPNEEETYEGYSRQKNKYLIKTQSGKELTIDSEVPSEKFEISYLYEGTVKMDVTETVSFGKNRLSILPQKDQQVVSHTGDLGLSMLNTKRDSTKWELSITEQRPMTLDGKKEGDIFKGSMYYQDGNHNKYPITSEQSPIKKDIFKDNSYIAKLPVVSDNNKSAGLYLMIVPGNKQGEYSNGELVWELSDTK